MSRKMGKYKHNCRWLNGRKCWQRGKHIKKSECSPCLVCSGLLKIAGFSQSQKKSPKEVK